MNIKINNTGAWDYNNSEHDESIHFDLGLMDYLIKFIKKHEIKSLFDFGCSTGYYLNYINNHLNDIELIGVEPSVNLSKKLKFNNIKELDLSQNFSLETKGSIICIEVIEHIPKEYESTVIDNIINHCDGFIFLSWAQEGQGGHGHVNEKNLDYVEDVFYKRGFTLLKEESLIARQSSRLPWIKNNFCIFYKNS